MGQDPLGHGQKKCGEEKGTDKNWFDDGTQGKPSGHHGCEFIVMVEKTETDNSGQEDQDGSKLVNNKGDVQQKEFDNQTDRFPCRHEVVYLFERVDKDINGDKGTGNGEKGAGELGKYVSVKENHSSLFFNIIFLCWRTKKLPATGAHLLNTCS